MDIPLIIDWHYFRSEQETDEESRSRICTYYCHYTPSDILINRTSCCMLPRNFRPDSPNKLRAFFPTTLQCLPRPCNDCCPWTKKACFLVFVLTAKAREYRLLRHVVKVWPLLAAVAVAFKKNLIAAKPLEQSRCLGGDIWL